MLYSALLNTGRSFIWMLGAFRKRANDDDQPDAPVTLNIFPGADGAFSRVPIHRDQELGLADDAKQGAVTVAHTGAAIIVREPL